MKLKPLKNIIKLSLISILAVLFILAVSSCGILGVVTEDRDVSDFSKIVIKGSGNLNIEQGDEESLTIKTTKNIIPYITTTVSNETLEIGIKPRATIIPIGVVNYYLKVKDLNAITVEGSANVNSSRLYTDNLEINIYGSGDIELAGRVEKQLIQISGSGNYSAKDLESRECVIEISGSGDSVINVNDSLDITISGSGDVSYIGNPSINQAISGSGDVRNISG